mmetsp:Transcript_21924/g.61278  ORF Transcript_21924/g.61278 Transcript_21924/m.61278 type:complete len:110 (+) Transcript_21924:93-422(+)
MISIRSLLLAALFFAAPLHFVAAEDDEDPAHEPDGEDDVDSVEAFMADFDKNDDGKLSIDEVLLVGEGDVDVRAHIEKLFKDADKDGDGILALEEVRVMLDFTEGGGEL